MTSRLGVVLAGCVTMAVLTGPADAQTADDVSLLLERAEAAVQEGDGAGYGALLAPNVPAERAAGIVDEIILPGATRAVVRERDRGPLPGVDEAHGQRLLVEVFVEVDRRGRIATYRLDLRRLAGGAGTDDAGSWRIVAQERLAMVDGLHRLALDRQRQFAVKDLTITAEDLTLTMTRGTAHAADVDGGTTALVLLGDGVMRFSPRPAAERGQVKIFSGSEVLESAFTAAFVRVNPFDFDAHFSPGSLAPQPVDPRALARAQEVFDTESPKSFNLDLNDLSRENWSLVPGNGDFLAEVRTRRFRTLTYARSLKEAEDITVFDRARRRNIAVYASEAKLRVRGRYYHEDELAEYDILQYDIAAAFTPEREWIEGRARLRLRVGRDTSTLSLRLHEALTVRAVLSDEFGRLLTLRVKGQNGFIISLPEILARDALLTLTVVYSGRLPPPPPDREAVAAGAGQTGSSARVSVDGPTIEPEPRLIYTTRSWWYPQGEISDYATASLRITVPAEFDVVGSGDPSPANPVVLPPDNANARSRKRFEFTAGQPVRYLSVLISRLVPAGSTTLPLRHLRHDTAADGAASPAAPLLVQPQAGQPSSGVYYDALEIAVLANPRQVGRGRALLAQAVEVLGFYVDLLQDAPYPSLTLVALDSELPGGHSPPYWAMLYQPLPTTPFSWRGDPVNFDSFPQFFVAHELAHQFWGQAVGWKNYHEQWISEGFSQYLAALYAERFRGPDTFRDLLRQMRRSAVERADQGPIHLGYRLGHIRSDGRVFRAIVYNKGAMVLHMLRRLVGDDLFFAGLRQLYRSSRFRKIGTDDVRRTFEQVTGRDLERFFAGWVLDSEIPTVWFRYQLDELQRPEAGAARTERMDRPLGSAGPALRLSFQQAPQVFDIPVTVTITYRNGEQQHVVVPLTERTVEHTIPLLGPVRDVAVNGDHGALARFERQ